MTGLRKRGFTLIELVLCITIFAVMAGCLYPFFLTAIESWLWVKDETDLLFESRQVLDTLEREIRQAKDILVQTDTTLSFKNVKDEDVTFTRDGTRLLVSKGAVTDALLSDKIELGEGGFLFSYLGADGTPAKQAEDIRMVRVQMSFMQGKSNPTLESLVKIRN